MSAWLERFRALNSKTCDTDNSDNVDNMRGRSLHNVENVDIVTVTHAEIELDAQLWAINEDLAREGTSLDKELAEFRKPKRKKPAEAVRQERWNRAYMGELWPRPLTLDEICACGDVVLWRRSQYEKWQCRSCVRPPFKAKVQWLVLPVRRGAPDAPS